MGTYLQISATRMSPYVKVRFENVHFSGAGMPVTLTCGTATTNFTGNVDQLGCSVIAGWGRLDKPIRHLRSNYFSDGRSG